MLLLNFSHPLTEVHLARIREIVERDINRVIHVPTHFNDALPFEEQVRKLVGTIPLTAEQWQSTPLIINPPSLAPLVAVLLAELHGLIGYFPTIVRLRSTAQKLPPEYEICELINLQSIRDNSRARR